MKPPFSPQAEQIMQAYSSRLPEKERRHYAALEAIKLGYGGKTYISKLLFINRPSLNKGIAELQDQTLLDEIPVGKQRRKGGGRKKNSTNSLRSRPC